MGVQVPRAMFLPLIAIAARPSPQIDVAYCARYYHQGKRPSYYHLYICRHDGGQRRQLTFGRKSAIGCVWIDRNHLAYLEWNGGVPLSFSYGARTWNGQIVMLNLKTGRRRTLWHVQSQEPWPTIDDDGRTITVGEEKAVAYTVSQRGVKAFPVKDPSDSPEFGQYVDSDPSYRGNIPAHGQSPAYQFEWNHSPSAGEPYDQFALKVHRGKEIRTYTLNEDTVGWARSVGADKLYVITELGFRKFNCDSILYRLDFPSGIANRLFSGAGNLSISPKRTLWLGTQTEGRPLEKLQDRRLVWVRWLYGGNWDSKREWTLAKGLVYVSRYQFRP